MQKRRREGTNNTCCSVKARAGPSSSQNKTLISACRRWGWRPCVGCRQRLSPLPWPLRWQGLRHPAPQGPPSPGPARWQSAAGRVGGCGERQGKQEDQQVNDKPAKRRESQGTGSGASSQALAQQHFNKHTVQPTHSAARPPAASSPVAHPPAASSLVRPPTW
jgi:hypothetical protein